VKSAYSRLARRNFVGASAQSREVALFIMPLRLIGEGAPLRIGG
jgi:hypothetical protein